MSRLNVLSLFAGIGGLELGLERAGMTVVGQVEIDDYCRRVLAKHWPNVPRHDDVRTAAAWWLSEERPPVDVICGGFPCQDISSAGRKAGIIEGRRSSLWTAMRDTVRRIRPRYVLVENVSDLLIRGLDVVAGDLASIGYCLRWDCLPAAAFGAPHVRDRFFGIAVEHANGCFDGAPWPRPTQRTSAGLHLAAGEPPADRGGEADWRTEPAVDRVADGVPRRVDRLRPYGNAVVPQVAEYVGRLIVEHAEAVAA